MDCNKNIFTNINDEINMGYNVIWIDDEWDTRGKNFIELCRLRHQILITPFKTRKDGIAALESNLKHWDAVILDAKAYNNSENEEADTDGLYAARERLIELRLQRYIPFFVLTGQPDLMSEKSFEKSVGKFYDKKKPDDVNKLIYDIKDEASKSSRYQIRSMYHDSVERLKNISIEACEVVVDILEAMHYPELPFTPKLYFNPLRQALEYIFRTANKAGIIPDDFFASGNVNLNQCFMYIIGRNAEIVGFRYGNQGERIAPGYIHNMMSLIINLGNIKSHSQLSDDEVQEAENKFLNDGVSSKNLVFSMALQLIEICAWMNRYIAEHPNREENLRMCRKLENASQEEIKEAVANVGIVERDEDGIFHIGDKFCLYSKLVQQNGWLGKELKIIRYDKNNNEKTREKDPYFAMNLQPLEENEENGSK
jgi:hypothetical protein